MVVPCSRGQGEISNVSACLRACSLNPLRVVADVEEHATHIAVASDGRLVEHEGY